MEVTDPKEVLEAEFLKRAEKNRRYSQRRFAEYLGISSGRLSEYLTGKRKITAKAALNMGQNLGLQPQQMEDFVNSCDCTQAKAISKSWRKQVDDCHFEVIADPRHFSVLSLMETSDFQSNDQWIAARLSTSVVDVRRIIRNLISAGFVEVKDAKYLLAQPNGVVTSDEKLNVANRLAHKCILSEATQTIDSVPVEQRDVRATTMAISPENIKRAKRAIRKFEKEIMELLEEGDQKEVYRLGIQLYPVTELRKTEKGKS